MTKKNDKKVDVKSRTSTPTNKNLTRRQRMLSSPTKLVEESENCLAALWRTILKDLKITEDKWNNLMAIYLTDPMNGFETYSKSLGDKRGNLNKALCGNKVQMLILNRAIRFLRTERATIILKLYSKDSKNYPPANYSINILYGDESNGQKNEALNEDLNAKKEVSRKRRFVNTYQKENIDVITKKHSGDHVLDQWLEDPNKKIGDATGPLSKLWRQILSDRNVDKSTWKALTTKYQKLRAPECDIFTGKETAKELKAKSKKKSNVKGNIADELQRTSFTIDVLMKGMVFLGIEKVDLTIRLKRTDNDKITTHELNGWDPMTVLDKYTIRDL